MTDAANYAKVFRAAALGVYDSMHNVVRDATGSIESMTIKLYPVGSEHKESCDEMLFKILTTIAETFERADNANKN